MTARFGKLVALEAVPARERYVRIISILGLGFGLAVAVYEASLGAIRVLSGRADTSELAAYSLLMAAIAIGFLYLAVAIRAGRNALYEEGLDLRNAWPLFGPRFHPWKQFSEARIEILGPPSQHLKRITLNRRDERRSYVLTTAFTDPGFVDAVEAFLESCAVLPVTRD